jgi:hypothetical protein
MAENARELGLDYEPVAWQDTAKPSEIVDLENWDNIDPQWHWMYRPLYTTPPYVATPLVQEPVAKDNSNYRLDPPRLDPAVGTQVSKTWTHDFMMQRLMELVNFSASAEREACAKVCDDLDDRHHAEDCPPCCCADAIRARGNT